MTTYTTPNVTTVATGITPHTKIIKDLNEFATKLHDFSSKVDDIYVGSKKVVSDAIEEKMASNEPLYADALDSSMDKFHNSWESYIDIKLSYFNSRLNSVFISNGLPGSNVSVETAEKNTDTAPSIENRYSM